MSEPRLEDLYATARNWINRAKWEAIGHEGVSELNRLLEAIAAAEYQRGMMDGSIEAARLFGFLPRGG